MPAKSNNSETNFRYIDVAAYQAHVLAAGSAFDAYYLALSFPDKVDVVLLHRYAGAKLFDGLSDFQRADFERLLGNYRIRNPERERDLEPVWAGTINENWGGLDRLDAQKLADSDCDRLLVAEYLAQLRKKVGQADPADAEVDVGAAPEAPAG